MIYGHAAITVGCHLMRPPRSRELLSAELRQHLIRLFCMRVRLCRAAAGMQIRSV
jgi:hypothetical protein